MSGLLVPADVLSAILSFYVFQWGIYVSRPRIDEGPAVTFVERQAVTIYMVLYMSSIFIVLFEFLRLSRSRCCYQVSTGDSWEFLFQKSFFVLMTIPLSIEVLFRTVFFLFFPSALSFGIPFPPFSTVDFALCLAWGRPFGYGVWLLPNHVGDAQYVHIHKHKPTCVQLCILVLKFGLFLIVGASKH